MRFAKQTSVMTAPPKTNPTRLLAWLWLSCLTLALTSCSNFEEKQLRELLHEKGFGARAQGVATRENYVGGLDWVQFMLGQNDVLQAGAWDGQMTYGSSPAPLGASPFHGERMQLP